MSTLPQRKPLRIKNYDYATPGTYFITIQTKEHKCFFWKTAKNLISTDQIQLSNTGLVVDECIKHIDTLHEAVTIDKYCIMPDHVHLLITIAENIVPSPNIPTLINQFKGNVTRKIGRSLWQRSYFDHAVRDEREYRQKWEYIHYNPLKYILKTDC